MRSLTLLCLRLFAAVVLLGGCELLTDGQGGATADPDDASSTTSPAHACDLACAQGSHCMLEGQGPVCVPDNPPVGVPGVDAGAPPIAACNLACIAGSHCVVATQGPECVPDSTPAADAGASPPTACNLACAVGRHCKLTAQGPTCVLDKPALDASVPVEIPCGKTTCAADEQCCSASCGICEPKGGACPAIACAPEDAALPHPTCASTQCLTGTYCDDSTGTPECKALPTCDTTKCPAGSYCDDITGTPMCKTLPSCDNFKCAGGTTCELVQVQCFRAPCPAVPECVPNGPQVCNLACKVGTHCVVSSNGPTCLPDVGGGSCGKKTCGANQICCSASCGICGSANGACPAIACAPTD